MADKPFLSVVMPVHDGAQWIEATLDSVTAEPTGGVDINVRIRNIRRPSELSVRRFGSDGLGLVSACTPEPGPADWRLDARSQVSAASH